jgi:hypothetical protein
MTLKQITLQRRDALLGYLRGYHGPHWRRIVIAKGLRLTRFEGRKPHHSSIDKADAYCHTLGFKWASDGVTSERNPGAVWHRRSVMRGTHAKERDFHALLSQSEYVRFRKILPKLQERAKSLAKAGQTMGYGIPSLEIPRRSRSRAKKRVPKRHTRPGGQSDPRLSLRGSPAPYDPSRDPIRRCVNAIFKRLPVETWELSTFTDDLFLDKPAPLRHILVARSSVEHNQAREVGGVVAGTNDRSLKTPPEIGRAHV